MQFQRIWRGLGANQKLFISLSIVAIGVVVMGLFVWSTRPHMQLLYSGMDGDDLAQVISHLEGQGISYEIGGGGSGVFVPSDQVYSLRIELASQGIPSGGSVGFEIFDENNFGISDFVQKTNFMRAVQGELSRTVTQMNGVRSARVMVSVPENRLLADHANIRPTASVFVDTGGRMLLEQAVNSIRFLVANAVEGLNVDDVAVVDNNGNSLSEALKGEGGLVGSGHMRFKQGLEDYFSEKIESMLSKVMGAGQVVARVSVKVDTETETVIEELYDPASQVIRSQTTTEDSSTSDDRQAIRVTGVAEEGPGGGGLAGGNQPVSSSKEVTKKKTVAYEISKSKIERVKMPGQLQEITAAVFLALRQKQEGEALVPDPRSAEEMGQIKQMILNALGITGGEQVVNVMVQEVPFMREEHVQEASLFGVPEIVHEWLDILKHFTAVGMALGMFLIFFKMLKSAGASRSKASVELLEDRENIRAKSVTSGSTVDLINELIQQKPENVSTALKNWTSKED